MVRKQLKVLQSLILSVFILGAGIQEAKAFGLLPPMPWDIEVDIPGNANKIVSNIKATYRQLQTIKSELNSQKLEILKKGQKFLKTTFSAEEEGDTNKAPGKGKLKASSLLGISGDINEEEYFNAFHTLFFVYPPKNSYQLPESDAEDGTSPVVNYPAVKQAYKRKANEYMQDITMETYLTGRVTENYLALVEKTIERLDNCQKGMYPEVEKHCVFFGLQMAYVEPQKDSLDKEGKPEDSTNPGQYGEVLNAYIVTTVYDRLMRIVEDLTGTEAQFLSAVQIDSVDPVEPDNQSSELDNQSSAEDYINTRYRFAYNESRDYALAAGKMLGGEYKRSDVCAQGGSNCPDKNDDSTEILNTDDTTILGKLQPIDEQINKAMNLHNLKSQLAEYKTQYRKYLKSKEIHERMLKVLEESEKNVVSFLDKYSNNQGEKIWYEGRKPSKVNDHENRGGLSKKVIEEYQEDATDKLIGTDSDDCSGFYETCPDGYTPDEGNPCVYTDSTGKQVESTTKFACVLNTITSDTDPEEDPKVSYTPKLDDYSIVEELKYNDMDYLKDGNEAENIETENRIKAEKNWRIGYDNIMELTENGTLKFAPWNDQKDLQTEYLRNKYRNIRMMINTVDQGMLSQRVANILTNSYNENGLIEKILPAVSSCQLTTEVAKNLFNEKCKNGGYVGECPSSPTNDVLECVAVKTISCSGERIVNTCIVKGDNSTGKIKLTKRDSCDNITVRSESYSQAIKSENGGCDFTKEKTDYSKIEDKGDKCPGEWDFSTKFLVKKYIPGVIASWKQDGTYEQTCPRDYDKQNEHLYKQTNKAGRVVAADHFIGILNTRKKVEQNLQDLIQDYNTKIDAIKKELEETINQRNNYVDKLDTATTNKNNAVEERQRSLQRVSAIISQIAELENRVEELEELQNNNPKQKAGLQKEIESIEKGAGDDSNKFDNPTLAQKKGQIPALKEELKYICYQAPEDDNHEVCKEYRSEASKEKEEIYQGTDIEFQNVGELSNIITQMNTEITSAKSMMSVLQEKVDELNQKLETTATEFAEDYIKESEEGQTKIENENRKLENKLEPKEDGTFPDRMENKNRERCNQILPWLPCNEYNTEYGYKSDNLSWTMARVMFGNTNTNNQNQVESELEGIIQDSINDRWFTPNWENQAAQKLKQAGVVEKFYIEDNVFDGINGGTYTRERLAQAIKEKAVKDAAKELKKKILRADEIIETEIEAAAKKVTSVMQRWKITGTDNNGADSAIFEHDKYAKDGATEAQKTDTQIITATHYKLLEDLKQPTEENKEILDEADIELQKIFGIPDEIKTDDDYFVALPARGYFGKKEDNDSQTNTFVQFGRNAEDFIVDNNDGRDYYAPRKPLLNLAPVREVFYFSALDYDDVPQNDGKPSLSALVDMKYKDTEKHQVEYLPETWRYLLATPNLRNDRKYQHTFVERSYGLDKLKNQLKNKGIDSAEPEHYRTIINRAGIYPCKLGDKYIDIAGGGDDSVAEIQFMRRLTPPQLPEVYQKDCREIALSGNGVRHLLADQDKAIQPELEISNEPMYGKYSELGQLLNDELKYRPILKNIYDYLLSDENQENNIERQRADTAVYKRNLIGSFLDAVNAEHSAQKALEKNEEDIKDSLKTLCNQLHNYGETVNGESGDDADSVCAEYIMENGGLAKDSNDNAYFEDKINCEQSNSGSYYETIFCKLDELKGEAINKAEQGYTDEEGTYEGFENVKTMEGHDKVTERIRNIQNYLNSFEKDEEEVTFIQPDSRPEDVEAAKVEAEVNRETSMEATEEGLKSMDNQSQAVPYAPIY